MKLIFLLSVCLLNLFISSHITGQETMPQGTFVQTCHPVLGEMYVFEGPNFKYYSNDLRLFGQGTCKLSKNKLSLDFTTPESFPAYQMNYDKSDLFSDKQIILKFFSPGRYQNQNGVWVELLDHENMVIKRTESTVVDSVVFAMSSISVVSGIRIRHPLEGEIVIPIENRNHSNISVDVFFQNNWEPIVRNTRSNFKIQNIRTSSFLKEKVLVKKPYYCVFVRYDQAIRLMDQYKH